MNNSQFRKLVLDTPARQPSSASPSENAANTSRNGATPSALGSRMRNSIPMTPRSIAGYNPNNDFARQLAERNSASSSQTAKKFRTTAAPKGAKLPSGYVDRAKQRLGNGDEDEGGEEGDKVKRVRALEEMMKLGQIDEETFRGLRDEILGNQVGAERAGLVKGLDWSLLERVKRGEVGVDDVLGGGKGSLAKEDEEGDDDDLDDEFERLESQEVEAAVKERAKKKGEMAPPALTGKKRNRDQILAEMKAARQAAKDAAQPTLGAKFKKVGERRIESRIERDGKGREVLITIDENGKEKRKVRKVQPEEPMLEKGHGLLMPDKDLKPLGMEVPDLPPAPEEEEDFDIFDGAGDDYDPLAGLEDGDSDEELGEDGQVPESSEALKAKSEEPKTVPGSMAPPPRPKQPSRNYFGDSKPSDESDMSKPKALSDPTILAALKKASNLNISSSSSGLSEEERAREEKRKRMLQQDDRDAQDMDMGFGSSRFGDEEEAEEGGKRIKLSEWGSKDEGDDEGKGGPKEKRKRGPKKRKGDANSAADVMSVLERRKGEKGA